VMEFFEQVIRPEVDKLRKLSQPQTRIRRPRAVFDAQAVTESIRRDLQAIQASREPSDEELNF
jgi:predicted component of type VI protein secretion system